MKRLEQTEIERESRRHKRSSEDALEGNLYLTAGHKHMNWLVAQDFPFGDSFF